MLAEQIILEGLGEAILMRIEQGLKRRQAPFGRLRRQKISANGGLAQFRPCTLDYPFTCSFMSRSFLAHSSVMCGDAEAIAGQAYPGRPKRRHASMASFWAPRSSMPTVF